MSTSLIAALYSLLPGTLGSGDTFLQALRGCTLPDFSVDEKFPGRLGFLKKPPLQRRSAP